MLYIPINNAENVIINVSIFGQNIESHYFNPVHIGTAKYNKNVK